MESTKSKYLAASTPQSLINFEISFFSLYSSSLPMTSSLMPYKYPLMIFTAFFVTLSSPSTIGEMYFTRSAFVIATGFASRSV